MSDEEKPARTLCVSVTGVEDPATITGPELEKVVDSDIKKFAAFYRKTLNNSELSGFEFAAIKTYLWWKYNVANPQRQADKDGSSAS
jgi:hypothetical protein